ncbi:S1 family peptidase [Micromonospora sp. PLK6-60]|uniref:S1 family peptidase n=1 Tax=Micromonospora sp. PLK6-60 TaxID=2873383 RepID=UPI001CA6009F|nr:S1 family peptidase [Micromonospora sp. PLK6-60]MBY8870632.1 S1 family peptidase [Micromonospora sp. PLK6-60]
MISILLVSGAPAAGAPDEGAPRRPQPAGVQPDTELSSALENAETTAELFAVKERFASVQPDAAAPEGSQARQAALVAAGDLVEMSGYDGVVTAAISRTASPSAFEAAKRSVTAARGRVATAVVRSSMTRAELSATKVRLAELYEKYASPGDGMSYSFDAAKDVVVVKGKLSPSLVARLKEIGHVRVEVDSSAEFTRDQGERYADSGPWHYGNAWIRNYRHGGSCSSGFTMNGPNNSGGYSVTAGHCGNSFDDFYSGEHFYGELQRAPYPTFDLGKITCCGQQYGKNIYTGQWVFRAQVTAFDPGLGKPGNNGACVSGQETRQEFCDLRVVSLSAVFCDTAGCTANLMEYRRDDGVRVTVGGDSGAAVYSLNAGNAQVHGMHIGSGTFSGGRTQFAEKYSTIQRYYGGGLRTW